MKNTLAVTHIVGLLLPMVLLGACAGDVGAPREARELYAPVKQSVSQSLRLKERDTEESLLNEEKAAIESALLLVPAEKREVVRGYLEDKNGATIVAAQTPTSAAAVARVYEIRSRRDKFARVERARAAARERSAKVTIVLSSDVEVGQAVVLRRSAEKPLNVVLLRDGLGAADALAAAMSTLQRSRSQDGDGIDENMRIRVNPPSRAGLRFAGYKQGVNVVAKLRASQPQAVPGFGEVRALTMTLRPIQ